MNDNRFHRSWHWNFFYATVKMKYPVNHDIISTQNVKGGNAYARCTTKKERLIETVFRMNEGGELVKSLVRRVKRLEIFRLSLPRGKKCFAIFRQSLHSVFKIHRGRFLWNERQIREAMQRPI